MTSLKDDLNVRVRKKGTKTVITVAVLLLTFCPLSACAPVLTIHSPDGDIIECINTLDQPSLNNPLLKKHVFQAVFKTRIYLCNIDAAGNLSVEILRDIWSPALKVTKVLEAIRSIFLKPETYNPALPVIALLYLSDREKHEEVAK